MEKKDNNNPSEHLSRLPESLGEEREARAKSDKLAKSSFGSLLRYWRTRRGLSQATMAALSGASQRHVSFLESGRAMPTRAMVLKLCEDLSLSAPETNQMFEAAGFAAIYHQSSLARGNAIAEVPAVLQVMQNHAPLPALLVDHFGDVVGINNPAVSLIDMMDGLSTVAQGTDLNIVELLCEAGPAHWFSNWEHVLGIARQILALRMAALSDDRAANLVGLIDSTLDQVSFDSQVTFDSRLPPYVELVTNFSSFSVNWYVAVVPFRVNVASELDSLYLLLLLPVDDEATLFVRNWQQN